MSTGMKMALRTYVMYLADALLCGMFLMWFSDWLVLQTIICLLLLIGFCLMCYNEGGWNGERACTIERSAEKHAAEGKRVHDEMKKQFFNKKHAVTCLLAAGLPLFLIAAANLAASPAYPEMPPLQEQSVVDTAENPFYFDNEAITEQIEERDAMAGNSEGSGIVWLRVVARVCFLPLLPLFTILYDHQTILYIIFVPFSFLMPACTAIGYLNGPKLREKKIEEIARGKVRKRRGLLVGERGVQNQHQRAPKQPKPKV